MSTPLSMTCFGRGETSDGARAWTVEIRSVNHRFCDVAIRMPRIWAGLEERIKKEITQIFHRGKIDVTITCQGVSGGCLQLNLDLAKQYYDNFLALQKEFSLQGQVDLQLMTSCKDIITAVDEAGDLDELWEAMQPALNEALANGLAMRQREGQHLKKDLSDRLSNFQATVAEIEQLAPKVVATKAIALKERVALLMEDNNVDENRLAQEIALMADKLDINEEIVRLKSHISQFAVFLEKEEAIGRRLDFLLQEFLREINTIASKISDVSVTHRAVELKNEIEKLREQVQNLE